MRKASAVRRGVASGSRSQVTKFAAPVWVTSRTAERCSAVSRANHGSRAAIAATPAAASCPEAGSMRRIVAAPTPAPAC